MEQFFNKLSEKEEFVILKKRKMVNIKLYDIHGKGPLENCKTLITDDKEYFYWDNKPFKKNSLGDIVFWVNRKEKIAYHTIIDAIDLQPYFESDKLIIDDLGYSVYVISSDPNRFQLFYKIFQFTIQLCDFANIHIWQKKDKKDGSSLPDIEKKGGERNA